MSAATTSPVVDLAPEIERCFLFDAVEDSYEIAEYSGRLPGWLRGSWYVNGPARFERAGQRYDHWLDGDGMVCALHLGGRNPRFVNRFVRTRKWLEEEAAGRFLFRGFGTAFAGDKLRRGVMLESPINVSVFPYGDRLLAFGEQSLPIELDPVTLETRGEFDFDGAINEVTPFSAHAKLDRGLLNFGVSFSVSQPTLNTYEFDESGRMSRRRHPLGHQYSIHDFGFTPGRMVFFLCPLLMRYERFRCDGVSIQDSLSWQPELGSRIFAVPRRGCSGQAFTVETGGGYCLHLVNCFETPGHLVVDVLLLDAPVYNEYLPVPDLFGTVPRCRPVRYIIDLASHDLSVCPMEYSNAPDFPSVDPRRAGHSYTDFWMLGISDQGKPGRKFFTELAHASWEKGGVFDIYRVPRGEYLCAEPAFAANPTNPSEAVVICEHFQPAYDRASIVVFDANNVREGPIASLPLRHAIHPGFHSTFAPSPGGVRQ